MRPTIKQLYNDPLAIIAALERAKFENARQRVMGIMRVLVEYWSMHRYVSRVEADRTYTHQSEARRMKWPGAVRDPEQARRNKKQIAEYDRALITGRSYLRRTEKKIENKIAKWPDLDLDPTTLRKKPDSLLVANVLKKRRNRGRRRTYVLG